MTAKSSKKKPKPSTPAGQSPRDVLTIYVTSDDPEEIRRAHAKQHTSGEFAALRVVRASEKTAGHQLDLPALLATLQEQAKAVNAGSLEHVEAMLMNQATALQTVFARLAERGMGCTDAVPFEINMRIALRAQSQCRATLETLAVIKNPPMVIAKQANVTTGPQQVNNGIPATSRARETENPPSKLLETDHGERMDAGTTSAATGADSALEAVGTIHRPADTGG